jgi:gliding motility-associated-like protein
MANNTIGGCTSGWSPGIEILALEPPVTGTIVINSPANPGSHAQYFDLACRSEIRNYSVAPVPGSNYRWRIPSLDIDTMGINSLDVTWDLQEGEYTLILQEISSEGCEGTLRQEWIYVSDPVLELGPDQSICNGDSIILQPEGNFSLYTWQNYSHQDTYVGRETGNVWLRVENEYSCQTSDTMVLEVHENPILFLGNDTMICDEAGYELVVEGFASYHWSTGETGNSVIIYPGNALISLIVTDINSCSANDSINISECGGGNLLGEITNTFTPNNDGIHDLWVINNIEQYPNAVIDVFDRTGRLVFHAQGYQNNWDGSFNGKPLLMDTYYYIIDFKTDTIKSLRGTVTIVRE